MIIRNGLQTFCESCGRPVKYKNLIKSQKTGKMLCRVCYNKENYHRFYQSIDEMINIPNKNKKLPRMSVLRIKAYKLNADETEFLIRKHGDKERIDKLKQTLRNTKLNNFKKQKEINKIKLINDETNKKFLDELINKNKQNKLSL